MRKAVQVLQLLASFGGQFRHNFHIVRRIGHYIYEPDFEDRPRQSQRFLMTLMLLFQLSLCDERVQAVVDVALLVAVAQ